MLSSLLGRYRLLFRARPSLTLWVSVFVGCLVPYLGTAHWAVGQVADGVAAAWPGWNFAHSGTFFLERAAGLPSNFAFGPADGHIVSFRTMGVVLISAPVNLLLGWTGLAPEAAGALTAALLTAAAMANVALLLRTMLQLRPTLLIVATLAFGSSAWTVASAELWTHGPDLFWLTAALLAGVSGRYWLSGVAFGAAMATRPHLALVALLVGTGFAITARTWRVLLPYAVTGAAAVAAMVSWNLFYYGAPSLLGAYAGHSGQVTDGLLTGGAGWVTNVAGMLISPWCGVILFSPFVLVGLWCLPRGWRTAPTWTITAAVGGVAYTLVQAKLNGFSGGGGFYGYRLTLEGLFLVAPLGAWSYSRVSEHRPLLRATAAALALFSVAVYGLGALLAYYWRGGASDWGAWYPYHVIKAAGPAAIPAAVIVLGSVSVAGLLLRRHPAGQQPLDPERGLELKQSGEQPVDESRTVVGR